MKTFDMVTCVFDQATGLFTINTAAKHKFVGYAGHKRGRNNPALQDRRSVGPLPRARYFISPARAHPRLGPIAMALTPALGSEMFGRSGFFIHGDNSTGDASRGCIILPRQARSMIADLIDAHRLAWLDVR